LTRKKYEQAAIFLQKNKQITKFYNPDKPGKCTLCYKKAVVSRHHISQCTLNTTA